MLPILLPIIIVAILFIVIIGGMPGTFVLSRSTRIAAPPEKIFPHVNDLHNWKAWSPWAKLDPNAKETFEGPQSGPGASMSWDGNKKIGAGKMTITENTPFNYIRFKLEFLRPFKNTNTSEFRLSPESNQTLVTWNMIGDSNFGFKIFSLFMNCDDMAGRDFEKGLASLKSLSESRA
jgi:hypothetical protein